MQVPAIKLARVAYSIRIPKISSEEIPAFRNTQVQPLQQQYMVHISRVNVLQMTLCLLVDGGVKNDNDTRAYVCDILFFSKYIDTCTYVTYTDILCWLFLISYAKMHDHNNTFT